jgi:hypothetical protein
MSRVPLTSFVIPVVAAVVVASLVHAAGQAHQNRIRPREALLLAGQEAAPQRAEPANQERPEQADEPGMRCPMMRGLRGVELHADTPAVLRARSRELDLEEEQVEKLKEIEETARQQAREALTPEQREKLEDDPEGPLSMMQLSRLRMRAMVREREPEGMCPMCLRMMREREEP